MEKLIKRILVPSSRGRDEKRWDQSVTVVVGRPRATQIEVYLTTVSGLVSLLYHHNVFKITHQRNTLDEKDINTSCFEPLPHDCSKVCRGPETAWVDYQSPFQIGLIS